MTRDDSMIVPGTGKTILDTTPVAQVLKYHHLGLAVTNIPASQAFFAKMGFLPTSATNILKNANGMQLHLLLADPPHDNNQQQQQQSNSNILQDTPTIKYCGHTHACFGVPSVTAARAFLEGQGMVISGDRTRNGHTYSVFVRDLDRTTWEFKRNVGEATLDNDAFVANMMGDAHRRIDHVGTRVSDATRSWQWYASMLGFNEEVMKSPHNPEEPLKNGRPWISRTQTTGIDINFLINANMPNDRNVLLKDDTGASHMKPGIVYVGVEVEDVPASQKALQEAGVAVYSDDTVVSVGLNKDKLPHCQGPSCFIADPDWNLYRLVQASS